MSLLQLSVCKVWFSEAAYRDLVVEAKNKLPLETGGVFIGYKSSENEIVITKIIGPGPSAVHESERFVPDQIYQEEELEKHFYSSKNTEVYLGDWHTHPSGRSYLSKLDFKTLKRIARYKESRLNHPLMGILNAEENEFKIWQYMPLSFPTSIFKSKIRRCELIFY